MEDNKFCPKCGNKVIVSDLKDSYNEYDYQCLKCDEDFFNIEVLDEENKLSET